MKRDRFVVILSLTCAVALAALGCSDDETPQADAAVTADASSADALNLTNQCSAADEAAMGAVYGVPDAGASDGGAADGGSSDGGGGTTFDDLVVQCGLNCVGQGQVNVPCPRDCLVQGTGGALSSGCATCVAQTLVCTFDNGCLLPCQSDPESQGCLDCRCGKTGGINCVTQYETCSGLTEDVNPCQ